jgi:5,6-dimethylbenzimidazole synthase
MMREPLAQLLDRTFSAAEREVIYRLMRSCGQVRRFAADPIPMETLRRVLDAALDSPFAGETPPWHFILVTSPDLRAAIMTAVEEGSGHDVSMCPDDFGHGLSAALTRERLSEAPLHLAVTYDCRRSGPIGLERNLAPSMDLYRTCCAIQHLWLAACAEGLGVVRIQPTDERAVAQLLALPPGVQLITYLGLGNLRSLACGPGERRGTHVVRSISAGTSTRTLGEEGTTREEGHTPSPIVCQACLWETV